MRVAAQTVFIAFCCVFLFAFFSPPAYAQTVTPSPSTDTQTNSNYTGNNNFLFPNTAADVPQNHHMFTQIELIDILSAFMCQLTGIDPTNTSQACLGVNPTNGQIGFSSSQSQQFAMATNTQPQLGGALGVMNHYIGTLYTPAISSEQYAGYLADNFSLTKPAFAATTNCNTSAFGYGFCGLSPLLTLWSDVRDLSYALLTILFIAIGIGVMFRFHVDPRTVMTLQNQIPRVIIAILLITFSFAIAGGLIDVMWTATYAGVNFISNSSPNSQINLCTPTQNKPQPLNQVVETRLIDQPISFTNTVFRSDPNCNAAFNNGLLNLSTKVSDSLGDLVQQVVHDALFSDGSSACHFSWWDLTGVGALINGGECALQQGALTVILWLAEFLVKIIILVTILVALFRLWYKLITCYLTFLIFVILGPIWIVLGLIPGRPMGFEKWLRIIFANIAVFPLVAFILVFARVISDLVPSGPSTPNTVFVPPLVGNPSVSTFSDLMGFGAILIAPTIPDIIKERLKAKSQSNLGAIVAGGLTAGVGATTAIPNQAYKRLNKRDQYGNALGPLARGRDVVADRVATKAANIPGLGWVGKQHRLNEAAKEGPTALKVAAGLEPQYKLRQKAFNEASKNHTSGRKPNGEGEYKDRRDFKRYWRRNGGHEAWAKHTNWQPPERYRRPEQPARRDEDFPPIPPPPPRDHK